MEDFSAFVPFSSAFTNVANVEQTLSLPPISALKFSKSDAVTKL